MSENVYYPRVTHQISGNTAGATANISTGTYVLAGGNNITLSQNANSITISAGAGGGGAWTASDNATSLAISRLAFTNSNGLTMTLSTTTGGSATLIGSYTVPTVTNSSWTVSDNGTSGTVARLAFTNQNGITLSLSTGAGGSHTIVGSYTVPTVTNSSMTVSDAATSGTLARLAFTNLNGVTLSLSTGAGGSHTIVGSHNGLTSQSNQAFSAAGGSSAFQTLSFGDTNSVSWTNTNGSVGIASIKLQMYAVSNTTQSSSGTANHTALSFGGAGIASVGVTGGSVVISVPSGGGGGDGGVFAGVSTGGNTAGSTGTVSTGNFVLVGSNNITLSQSTGAAGSAATVTIQGPNLLSVGMSTEGNTNGTTGLVNERMVFVGTNNVRLSQSVNGQSATLSFDLQLISSFQNMPIIENSSALTFGMTSLSHAVAFNLPKPGSFSYLRVPALMTTNSTTIATMASATATASGALYSTMNAVVYSMGTGANSLSLRSVASGSGGFTMSQQISITNSTQASYSLGVTQQAEGASTTRTTQYSVSNTNYSFTTNQIATEFSSLRFIDIPFANSLTAGPYWLVIGGSSSTASGGAAGLAALTNCNVRYSNHYGASQANLGFGVMGSTNLTSGGQLGNGFFSTAGGGTTNSIPLSAISSTASNPIPFFILNRRT